MSHYQHMWLQEPRLRDSYSFSVPSDPSGLPTPARGDQHARDMESFWLREAHAPELDFSLPGMPPAKILAVEEEEEEESQGFPAPKPPLPPGEAFDRFSSIFFPLSARERAHEESWASKWPPFATASGAHSTAVHAGREGMQVIPSIPLPSRAALVGDRVQVHVQLSPQQHLDLSVEPDMLRAPPKPNTVEVEEVVEEQD